MIWWKTSAKCKHTGRMSKECGRVFWVQVIERSEKRPDKIMQREQPEMNEEPEQEPGNPVCTRRLKAVAGSIRICVDTYMDIGYLHYIFYNTKMYICLLHVHLYTYDMRVLYIFSNHMFTWWFSHPWHLGLLICRSRYETPNGEEEAPYYLESKIRQNDGLSRAELTDSEPRLELAIQNPYPPTDFLKMMCFSPWNWKNPRRLTGTWFTYKSPLRKILENDLPSKPPWGHVPTLIFRVGVVSFLGSSPPTSPGPSPKGGESDPENCLRNSACKPLVPLHAVFPLPLVAGKVWFRGDVFRVPHHLTKW